ncbi:gamma-glutamylaminecyclotransferase [Plakobranchus ocellatus]|uniref:Gamma-glutamylcyclotransferase family protein n=1 Tax=Plakobranchus ocellatus TaxID=259542 RepID=A0AAV4BLF8_9GAST|nr:gamma-glutamylaminecyclotransferase [Plakobranchus ocellatus]
MTTTMDNPTTTHLAFMYGTLKSTEANHRVLFDKDPAGVAFVGQGQTAELFPLVVTTPFNIPFLLYKEETGKQVQGEIYQISERTLNLLDDFEGHPDFYERRKVKAELLTDSEGRPLDDSPKLVDVWLYGLPRFKKSLLELPYLPTYKGDGVVAPKYKVYSPDIDGPLDKYLHEV